RAGGIYPGTLPLDRVEVLGSVDGVTTSFQLSQNSRPSCSIIKDKYMMKAQVHVSKSFAIFDVQALPQRKHYCQNVKVYVEGEIDSSYDVLEGVEGVFVAAAKVGQQRGDVACLVTKRWTEGACKLLCKGMGSIISMVSISPEGFLPSILLLVVVIVMVVIVAVILVVVVVAIDGVVIVVMIIGVEVVVMIIG
nr:hypothetical protein [Tanacetum cinerariifolium]